MHTNSFQQKLNPLRYLDSTKEFAELNIETFQAFSYITPMDLFTTHKPEELLEKQVDVFIDNSHKTLDYLQKVFHIMEQQWFNSTQHLIRDTQESIKKVRATARNNIKNAIKAEKQIERKVLPSLRVEIKPRAHEKSGAAHHKTAKKQK